MYETTPGIKSKFNGVALHPYTGSYQELTAEIEEVRDGPESQRRRRQGPLDHRARLELAAAARNPLAEHLRQGPGRPGRPSSKAPSRCSSSNQAKWKLQRIYWFSVDDQPGTCNFCDGSGLFGHGFVPKKSWYAYVKFAGGTP